MFGSFIDSGLEVKDVMSTDIIKKEDAELLNLYDVRIAPPIMYFNDAFEGRKYDQIMTITNCGTKSATIRIGQPTSSSFSIQSFTRGKYLPPGLSLKRHIKYTYMRGTSIQLASIPIYINDCCIRYRLSVRLSDVMIFAVPQEIDFGTIDAGFTPAVRMLSLRNYGSKGTRFAIDLGKNEIDLTVEPNKGVIQPRETMHFRVECLGTIEGQYQTEFWFKCEKPMKISVKVNVLGPKLHSYHPVATTNFTFVDFSRTYFGCGVTKTLVIRNVSSHAAVYCVLADIVKNTMTIAEGRQQDSNYLDFEVFPQEGSFQPQEGRILQIIYRPIKKGYIKKLSQLIEHPSFCSFAINRIPCTNINEIIFNETSGMTRERCIEEDHRTSAMTYREDASVQISEEPFAPEAFTARNLVNREPESSQDMQVCLSDNVEILVYGEAEVPKVDLRPDSFDLIIPINTVVKRELLIENKSSALPIFFNYVKACFVKVEPKSGFLNPCEKVEVAVSITAAKFGEVSTKISFDLIYYDRPKETADYIKVGHTTATLHFNVPCTVAKDIPDVVPSFVKNICCTTSDIKCITPPTKLILNCATIAPSFPKLPIDLTLEKYQLSASKEELMKKNNSYYINFIRKKIMLKQNLAASNNVQSSDYDITNQAHLLFQHPIDVRCPNAIKEKELTHPSAMNLPLTPLELKKIKVTPALIALGKIAPLTKLIRKVKIVNFNDFSVVAEAYSRKRFVTIEYGKTKTIKQNEEVEFILTCTAPFQQGRYGVIVDFVMNQSHSFTVSISGEVLPRRVRFSSIDIEFSSRETFVQYVDIYNVLNVDVQCSWVIPNSCFVFYPSCAVIPPYSYITCQIAYTPQYGLPSCIHASLRSECGTTNNVNVISNIYSPKIAFSNHKIICNDLPVNILVEKTIVIKNLEHLAIIFEVQNPQPIEGFSVVPYEGTIAGYGEETLFLQFKIKACIEFTCTVEVQIQMTKTYRFNVIGNVVYPDIVFKPEIVKPKKIVADSFVKQNFTIFNRSNAPATVEFVLDDYPEYIVTESSAYTSNIKCLKKIDLEPIQQKNLYLLFKPLGAASYKICLPTIINGLLGPSTLMDRNTLKPIFFMKDAFEYYVGYETITEVAIPKKLASLQITACVGGDLLRFSKLNMNFKYFPNPSYMSETVIDLKIWNSSKEEQKLCLRTDELRPPFSVEYLSGNKVEILDLSLVCALAPTESVYLRVSFNPRHSGDYKIKLPIYVKNYMQLQVFNYLFFSGIYPKPQLSLPEKNISLIPAPLGLETKRRITIKCEYHQKNCKISYKSDVAAIMITFHQQPHLMPDSIVKNITAELQLAFITPRGLNTSVTFLCTCGCGVELGIFANIDNSILTNYIYSEAYIKWKNCDKDVTMYVVEEENHENNKIKGKDFKERVSNYTTSTTSTMYEPGRVFDYNLYLEDETFPFFPGNNSNTDSAVHLRSVLTALEGWLFHQGFYGKVYCKIPEGIAAFPQTDTTNVRYLELLKNLVGPRVNNYVTIPLTLPEDKFLRTRCIYDMYLAAIKFITQHGGFLNHVFPEYLLEYTDYLLFMKEGNDKDVSSDDILDRPDFLLKSKQSWIDLLLQTYKVFVLGRIRCPTDEEISNNYTEISVDKTQLDKNQQHITHFQILDDADFWQNVKNKEHEYKNIYSISETILLFWLEFHFNKTRGRITKENKFKSRNYKLPARTVQFFEYDLQDSLVLIAVTYAYCPYMIDVLSDIYLFPSTQEQLFHNACKLVQCWKKLKFSFEITPTQIIWPNAIQMVMLVAYLYQVLPTFYPYNLITLETGLGSTAFGSIPIENPNEFWVSYEVIFFHNELDLFKVDTLNVVLKEASTSRIKIRFNAKFARYTDVVIIFNGEVRGSSYAKSMAFYLLGIPVLTKATSTVTFTCELYKMTQLNMDAQSPYTFEASYDIFYTIKEPTDIDLLQLFSVDKDIQERIPKSLLFSKPVLDCDESGVGEAELTVSVLTFTERYYWIMFRNTEIGDFIVILNILPEIDKEMNCPLYITAPKQVVKESLFCSTSTKYISIDIPCYNILLQNVLEKLVIYISDDNSLPFWKKYLGMRQCFYILKWRFLRLRTTLLEVIKTSVTYTITTKGLSDKVHLPETTTIANTLSFSPHTIQLRYNDSRDLPESFYMTLQSENGLEYRLYQINFVNE